MTDSLFQQKCQAIISRMIDDLAPQDEQMHLDIIRRTTGAIVPMNGSALYHAAWKEIAVRKEGGAMLRRRIAWLMCHFCRQFKSGERLEDHPHFLWVTRRNGTSPEGIEWERLARKCAIIAVYGFVAGIFADAQDKVGLQG